MISVSFISTINKNEFIKVRLKFYKSYRKWTESLSFWPLHSRRNCYVSYKPKHLSKPLCLLENYNRNKKIIKYNKQLNDLCFYSTNWLFFPFCFFAGKTNGFWKMKAIFFWRRNEISIRIWGILLIHWGNGKIWN